MGGGSRSVRSYFPFQGPQLLSRYLQTIYGVVELTTEVGTPRQVHFIQ